MNYSKMFYLQPKNSPVRFSPGQRCVQYTIVINTTERTLAQQLKYKHNRIFYHIN